MISFRLPVYWVNEKKTKPSTTHLVGMNWYRNAHYHIKNKVKVDFHELVAATLDSPLPRIRGQYNVEYIYHYKTASSDLMNVGSIISKFVNDSLQELGIVTNDNVQFCVDEHFKVGSQNKADPHIQITIKEV